MSAWYSVIKIYGIVNVVTYAMPMVTAPTNATYKLLVADSAAIPRHKISCPPMYAHLNPKIELERVKIDLFNQKPLFTFHFSNHFGQICIDRV